MTFQEVAEKLQNKKEIMVKVPSHPGKPKLDEGAPAEGEMVLVGYYSQCPGHEDKDDDGRIIRSFTMSKLPKNKYSFHCKRGCSYSTIAYALGISKDRPISALLKVDPSMLVSGESMQMAQSQQINELLRQNAAMMERLNKLEGKGVNV